MPPPDEILTCLKRAKSELLANNLTPETASASKFSPLRSWDDCFNHFCDSISKQDPEPDRYEQATLNLAWYLASFGMYRGSSILLQSSRHILSSTVELILDSGIKPCMPGDPLPEPTAILELKENIQNNLGASIPNIKFTVSDTLVSKILMGTVGCCPAYDSNFIAGIDYINTTLTKDNQRQLPRGIKKFSSKGFPELIKLLKNDEINRFFSEICDNYEGSAPCPIMRAVDIFFWHTGLFSKLKKS